MTSISPTVDPSSADETDEGAAAEPPASSRRPALADLPRAALRQLPVVIPSLIWLVMAWQRRWIADDGMIEARTVRQILAGNGPVFNMGERVEANTPTLWTWLLALVTWVSHASVYAVMLGCGLVLAPLGLLLAVLGSRTLHRRTSPGRAYLPLGAVVVVALPPFWDFATSGLEDSLTFCWLGLLWWLLTGLTRDSRRRAAWCALVAGLGWLVRPDMAMGTAFFLVALWLIVRPGWLRTTVLVLIAAAAPFAYEVFRMGYYALLVPNTAVAKNASSTDIRQGLKYLKDFVEPYSLWIPLVLLLILLPLTFSWRRLDFAGRVACLTSLGAGSLMAVYVVAIGGDFMHARMLLPATFTLLLPVMTVPVPRLSAAALKAAGALRTTVPAFACVAALVVWAAFCSTGWREPGGISAAGIADERAWYVNVTGTRNPDVPVEYDDAVYGMVSADGSQAWEIVQAGSDPKPVLLYNPSDDPDAVVSVPLDKMQYSVAMPGVVLGTLGALVPLNGLVIDQHGLSSALGSHLKAIPGDRVGHAKTMDLVWIIAEYSSAVSVPGIPAADIAAARHALSCGELAQLIRATSATLTLHRFLSNIADSPGLTKLSISNNPYQAEAALCKS